MEKEDAPLREADVQMNGWLFSLHPSIRSLLCGFHFISALCIDPAWRGGSYTNMANEARSIVAAVTAIN